MHPIFGCIDWILSHTINPSVGARAIDTIIGRVRCGDAVGIPPVAEMISDLHYYYYTATTMKQWNWIEYVPLHASNHRYK